MIEKYINPHTESELKLYEDSVNAYRDIVNAIRTAEKKKFAEGRAEGRAEGIKQSQLDTARMMLEDGEPVSKITRYTGLTKEEIETIR